MHPSPPVYRQEFDELEQLALRFGLDNLTNMLEARQCLPERPFVILVAGEDDRDRATLLSVLAERELPGTGQRLNVYRGVSMLREGLEIRHAKGSAIEMAVWSVCAPALPENVVLANLPSAASDEVLEQALWLADAVIWVVSAQRTEDHFRCTLDRHPRRGMPALAAVTFPPAMPLSERETKLDHLQDEFSPSLDRVITFSPRFGDDGKLIEKTVLPVRVEVRTRLFRGARRLRDRSQQDFAKAFRSAVAHGFEETIDRVLSDRARHLELLGRMHRRLDRLFSMATGRLSDLPESGQVFENLDAALETLFGTLHSELCDIYPDVPTTPAIRHRFSTASASLDDCRTEVEIAIREVMDRLFAQRHGFNTGDVLERLGPLEQEYLRMKGRRLEVPSPFTAPGGLSPLQFLFRIQDPGFVDRWNRAVAHQFVSRTIPGLRRRLVQHIERAGEQLVREWDQRREVLTAAVSERWPQAVRELARNREIQWPVGWALDSMRSLMVDPVEFIIGRPYPVRVPDGVSLLIGEDMRGFLQPLRQLESIGEFPWHRVPASCFSVAFQTEARRAWSAGAYVGIPTSRRRITGRAAAAATIVATGLGLAAYGLGSAVGFVLPVFAALQSGSSWTWISRIISGPGREQAVFHAEVLHSSIRKLLIEFIERIQYRIDDMANDRRFLAELESSITAGDACRSLNYRDLIERLERSMLRCH